MKDIRRLAIIFWNQNILIFIGWWYLVVFSMFSRFIIMIFTSLCKFWSFVFSLPWKIGIFFNTSPLYVCEDTITAVLEIEHYFSSVILIGHFECLYNIELSSMSYDVRVLFFGALELGLAGFHYGPCCLT